MLKTALKVILPVLVLAGAAFGAREIIRAAPQEKPRAPDDRTPVVRVLEVVPEDVRIEVETYGTVHPRTELQIVPQVSGKVVYLSPALREGGFFQEGDLLVRIDRRDYELAKTQAKAGVAQAQARLDREEAEARIAKKEWAEYGKGDPNPLVLREPQMLEARAVLASANARLDAAQLNLDRTEIKAPTDGRVRTRSVARGQFLTAGAPIASVYATDYVEVRLAVPDREIEFLDLPLRFDAKPAGEGEAAEKADSGPFVTLTATFGGRVDKWIGRIVRTEAEVDPKTRVVHIRARVDKPYEKLEPGQPPLMIGMYLKAVIPGRTLPGVVAIPRSALVSGDSVIVVDEESKLRMRAVRVLREEGGRVLLSGGLQAGERICLTRVDPVVNGMRVRIEGEP